MKSFLEPFSKKIDYNLKFNSKTLCKTHNMVFLQFSIGLRQFQKSTLQLQMRIFLNKNEVS